MVNVQRQGDNQLDANSQVLVPRITFSCIGRLTGYLISLDQDTNGDNYPHIEIWHPVTPRSDRPTYIRLSEYVLTENDITEMDNYYFANISFAINETSRLQPGDVIGYYQPPNPRYTVWSVNTTGCISNIISTDTFRMFIYVADVLNTVNDRQPLIQVLYGMMTCIAI